jgi:hypothetical protein
LIWKKVKVKTQISVRMDASVGSGRALQRSSDAQMKMCVWHLPFVGAQREGFGNPRCVVVVLVVLVFTQQPTHTQESAEKTTKEQQPQQNQPQANHSNARAAEESAKEERRGGLQAGGGGRPRTLQVIPMIRTPQAAIAQTHHTHEKGARICGGKKNSKFYLGSSSDSKAKSWMKMDVHNTLAFRRKQRRPTTTSDQASSSTPNGVVQQPCDGHLG